MTIEKGGKLVTLMFAINRRCRSGRSWKLFFDLFYNDFAPTALPLAGSIASTALAEW